MKWGGCGEKDLQKSLSEELGGNKWGGNGWKREGPGGSGGEKNGKRKWELGWESPSP